MILGGLRDLLQDCLVDIELKETVINHEFRIYEN